MVGGAENLLDIKFQDVVLVEMKKLNEIESPNLETLVFNKKVPFTFDKPLTFDVDLHISDRTKRQKSDAESISSGN